MTMLQLTRLSLSLKFLGQKPINKMEHSPYSPRLAPNDFWLFPETKPVLKGWIFQDIKNIQNKSVKAIKVIPREGVPKMFPTVAASLG
jgi:hypothetical protein